MKYQVIATLVVAGFIAAGIKVKASPATPPVYDGKSAPGSMCRAYFCTWAPSNESTQFYDITNLYGGAVNGTVHITGPYPQATRRCDVTCPIIRDRPDDPAGITVAWIDITLAQYGNTPLPDPDRRATCNIVETTSLYTYQTINGPFTTEMEVKGPNTTWLAERSVIYRGTLTAPTPPTTIPPPNSGTINGFAYGAAAIHCSMPPDTTISKYGWLEHGGESTDY